MRVLSKSNKLYRAEILVLAVIGVFLFIKQSYASQNFMFSEAKKIEAVISEVELSRIAITGGEIMEVIGDESKYSLYWSGDWRNLFIKPKVEAGERIELSLIASHGKAQDIGFNVAAVSGQTIFINMGNSARDSSNSLVSIPDPRLKSEIASMMRSMIEGVKGKYYVVGNKRVVKQSKELLIKQSASYRFRDLSGAVLLVKNLTSKPLTLNEPDFKNLFSRPLAINLSSNVLKKGETTSVYIITREERHD